MKTSRKWLLAAAVLGTVTAAGCASDPYRDNYAYYDRYTYSTPGYTYYTPRSYGYYEYSPRYYYGPRYYGYGYSDRFWRAQPQPG